MKSILFRVGSTELETRHMKCVHPTDQAFVSSVTARVIRGRH